MFLTETPDWQALGRQILARAETELGPLGLDPATLGLVLVSPGPDGPEGFAVNGMAPVYPCSLVKAFHLIHALAALEEGRVQAHGEMDRALRDMIRWSSNTATNYVIDLVTGTTGDTLLAGAEFDSWRGKREALNRFFTTGTWSAFAPDFAQCNISQKLMDDARYGREAQYAGAGGEYLNALTPLAPARLVFEIFAGDVPLSGASRQRAQDILLRDRASAEARMPHFQVDTFLGGGVPAAATLWSKAGQNSWTGAERASYYKHDLIRVALPGAAPVILCLMTQGKEICEDHPEVFPEIGRLFCDRLLA